MRILLAGGGSGGHTFPLLATAEEIKRLDPDSELFFIAPDKKSLEVFSTSGIEHRKAIAPKFRRYLSPLNLIDIFKIPIGLVQAYWQILSIMPDLLFAKGGYGSVPVSIMSWIFRIPVIIHESDSVPGAANRFVSKFSKKIILSFKESAQYFRPSKTVILGNPVRPNLFSMNPEKARQILSLKSNDPVILIMGGSRGAKEINDLICLASKDLIKSFEVVHQCGPANFKEVKQLIAFELKENPDKNRYHIYSFLNEPQLASAYALSRVIISRAGSGAIFEIAAAKKPSILLPYKHSAGGHQEKNAHIYSKTGAATILEDKNIIPHILINEINSIINNADKEKAMQSAAESFSKPDAAQKIAKFLLYDE